MIPEIEARLERTAVLIRSLEDRCRRLIEEPVPETWTDYDGTGTSTLRLRVPPLPRSLGITASECVHHLRAALDNLIYSLVTADGFVPPERNAIAFPLFSTAAAYDEARVRSHHLLNASDGLAHAVRELQPFQASKPVHRALSQLQRLSNIDKHRVLLPAVAVSNSAAIAQRVRMKALEGGQVKVQIGFTNNVGLSADELELIRARTEPPKALELQLASALDVILTVTFGPDRDVSLHGLTSIREQVHDVVMSLSSLD